MSEEQLKSKDLLALRLSKEDEQDIIPWLNGKGITRKDWAAFIRRVLRDTIRRERNPFEAPSRTELADLIGNLVRDAINGTEIDIPLGSGLQSIPEPVVNAVEQRVRSSLVRMGMEDEDDD